MARTGPEYKQALQFASAGLEFIMTFGLGLGGGLWLDHRFGWTPAMTLIGGGLGFTLGLVRLVVEAKRLMEPDRRYPSQDRNRGGPDDAK